MVGSVLKSNTHLEEYAVHREEYTPERGGGLDGADAPVRGRVLVASFFRGGHRERLLVG